MFNAMYRRGITVTNNHSVPFRHFTIYTFLPPPQRRVWKGVKRCRRTRIGMNCVQDLPSTYRRLSSTAKLDYIRKVKQRAQEIYLEDLEIEPYVDFEEQYVKAYSNTQSFEFEEEKLANAFLSLPLMRQRVLEMLFIEELSAIEIAQKMNCSVKYVYDQKYLALQKLRKSLGGETDDQK